MNKYVEPTFIDKSEFEKVLEFGSVESRCDAIVRAVYFISDYDWLLAKYTELLNGSDIQVRGVTATCIGHIARLNETADKNQLLKILMPLEYDKDIAGLVEDAIEDINVFL